MLTEEKKINILKNRAETMNKVHSYCNKVVPELLEELDKGFKLTINFQFFKKDKERLQSIIKKHKISIKLPGWFGDVRVYLECTEYSIILNVDDRYSVSEHSCAYYKKHVYLYTTQGTYTDPTPKPYEFKPFEMVTERQLIEATNKKRELKGKIQELRSEVSSINLLLE